MLSNNDLALLRRAIGSNRCVLLLGAGFSAEAQNRLSTAIPAGFSLGQQLWEVLGYGDGHGAYDGSTTLQLLFEAARRRMGDRALLQFFEDRLTVRSYPQWYASIVGIYWRRIYTTNVDDLLERIYNDARRVRLRPINAQAEGYVDRDVFLDEIQYVKLNGSLAEKSLDQLTFGARQYGSRAGQYDAWYDHFVRDYSQYSTILVGSQLNEPLFWQALESRKRRLGAPQERRARSFLVSRVISPAIADALAEYNVVPVEADARPFFVWLTQALGDLPNRDEVLLAANPAFVKFIEARDKQGGRTHAIDYFFRAFSNVEPSSPPEGYRSLFLLGSMPRWHDIAAELDVKRETTDRCYDQASELLDRRGSTDLLVISGHRGAGKSTMLMRTAWDLSATGHPVFFAYGENVPAPWELAEAVGLFGRRVLLAIDDAEWIIGKIGEYVSHLNKLDNPPLLLLALRANVMYRLEENDLNYEECEIDDLTSTDITKLVDLLRREGRLGSMVDADDAEIEAAFVKRARKQLLVALKEVTSGEDFDKIIQKEFDDLDRPEYRVTYLTACLATAAGASIRSDQLLACSELPPAEFFSALNREFKQLLVPVEGVEHRLAARHALIAETIVDTLAPRDQLAAAYRRLMQVLAHDIGPNPNRGPSRRWFRLYKRLINHDDILKRFDIETARSIYDDIRAYFSGDAHYWLQYGSLELQEGQLELADHYLHTAATLRPDDYMVRHATGHLRMLQARDAPNEAQASAFRREGDAVLRELMSERDSAYPWHTLIALTHHWLQRWEPDVTARRAEYEMLRELVDEACEAFAWNAELKDLRTEIQKAYLETSY